MREQIEAMKAIWTEAKPEYHGEIEAKRLLEMTTLPVEDVATKAGFGSVGTLRHHFHRLVGLSPREYRDNFTG